MKFRYLKSILPAALSAFLLVGQTSCVNDLDISPINPQVSSTFSKDEVLAKLYASLVLTGQKGVSDNPDIASDDEGMTGFYRSFFTLEEYGTDEMIWTWQDTGIPELIFLRWSSSHSMVSMAYNRIGYNITLCNFFLDETEGATDEATVRQRAEARFLRAYYYSCYLDLFGKAPFKEHFDNDLPVEKSGKELFEYIESELAAIENDLYAPGANPTSYRANQAADWLLRARLYLNAQVYTGTARWSDAATYASKVIENGGYSLCGDYAQLFMADNGENADVQKETIFSIAQDGISTKSYAGTYFLVASTRISGMPDCGVSDLWSCIRSREALVGKFFTSTSSAPLTNSVDEVIAAAKDDRALFYSGDGGGTQRKVNLESVTTFTDGFSLVKWTALKSDGTSGKDVNVPDTDIPLFRLAEAYLIRAEANLRAGTTTGDTPVNDINKLRSRAHASTVSSVTLDYILDERARELYMEGFRRTDLVRYDYFTTGKYLWDWKGGVAEGTSVSSIYNLYPIPDSDMNTNGNMTQNTGY